MMLLKLFLTFLKIGVVSFGGGYGMISLIRETVLSNDWLTEEELLNFIAISESTPGPIAVNMATFVGSSQAGILGAFCATLGIVLPSFIIILLIVTILNNLMKFAGIKFVLSSIRPTIVALIFSTFIIMFLSLIFGIKTVHSSVKFDWKGLTIFCILACVILLYKKIRKKSISPILLIILSSILGLLFYI